MGKVKRCTTYLAENDEGPFEMVMAAAYDRLLADARRLRDAMVFNYEGNCPQWGLPLCDCDHCTILRDTAYLEETP